MAGLDDLVAPAPPEKEAWVTFSGPIDQNSLNRIFNTFSVATHSQYTRVHMLFQSGGGIVGDGIALYNFFRTLPIKLRVHNVGTVASIATIAFLGAETRIASKHSAFMIHRTQMAPTPVTSERMAALAHSLELDDHRTMSILKDRLDLSEEQWKVHSAADLWLTSAEAVDSKLATEIGEFSPPLGASLANI